ncbi:MAG: hypothetical protein HYY06_26510 [Deltaproteobacteria bacterium]|nr:hypothetical protein [Deltaproteobacteria bacterium]
MRRLLVIEDGSEYSDFARLYLADEFEVTTARSASEALRMLAAESADAFLFDLRFDRAEPGTLVGDVDATARRLFGGDRGRALRYLQDQQGALILAELRSAGHAQPAVFVHDFPERRLANLRQLYGSVAAVASFDARAIGALLSR